MTPSDLNSFFATSAGVAGALVGLLFVAISVSGDRLSHHVDARAYRLRASGTLTAFTNALAVSLFAILPGKKVGYTTVSVSVVGLMFVAASMISLVRAHALKWRYRRDVAFLATLTAAFAFQLGFGLAIIAKPHDTDAVDNVAILVIVFFLIGIARTWELIGGPAFGLAHEIRGLAGHGEPKEEDQSAFGSEGDAAAP
ncbi:hypothetical protein KGQ20_16010 [Catenulispora sp. NF23]|uniref:Uncharacterized protein n=1 Tax=Catenulispora pinistramenti TaxID=2705254 RepID=A0ABS5KM23_9ACTN|nr:hypothetical protein [Catenulispora pinistramenti]MBS2534276.1 hypothetical protein [Catenulispora pinistramenti]MBS2547099.1 hypothetical protein [Catenulispora pinistramenti]